MDNSRWTVRFKKSAKRELSEIDDSDSKEAVAQKIAGLEINAFPRGCCKISGRNNTWRIRVGNFCIIYEVTKSMLLIIVIKIGERKDVYKDI